MPVLIPEMIYTLIKDIYSISKPSYCYGKKGNKVKIIYEQNASCIVENEKGERFNIRFNLLEKS
jgi:glutathionyl-hydroquinone reductase